MATDQVLLLGPPGAGKGTQSANIAEAYDLEHITTGDALRERKDMETPHGSPREYMEAGELVPDSVVNEIVKAAIDSAEGFVLDGYPRNKAQAEYLDGIADLDVVLYLEVSQDELQRRLTGRRVCRECGANYHVEYAPPETEGVCDECGGELVQRDDDKPETVQERLRVYRENTAPVVEWYRELHPNFVEIDGEQSPAAVWNAIDDELRR